MRIAIQGHQIKGDKVIQILESLGGKNQYGLQGCSPNNYYFIRFSDNVIHCHNLSFINKFYKKYTLEQFRKAFPFKIGDKVKYISSTGTVIDYCYIGNEPACKIKSSKLGLHSNIPVKLLEICD